MLNKFCILLLILILICLTLLMVQKVIKDIYELKELKGKWKTKNKFEELLKRLEKIKEEKGILSDECHERCDWNSIYRIDHEIIILNEMIKIIKEESGFE